MARDSLSTDDIASLIHPLRGRRVILAADLAKLFGVSTGRLNEQVKRNLEKFPRDFMFQTTRKELLAISRSQIAILKRGQHSKYLPYAFTERGALMAA